MCCTFGLSCDCDCPGVFVEVKDLADQGDGSGFGKWLVWEVSGVMLSTDDLHKAPN
jgi:hypothetical protein